MSDWYNRPRVFEIWLPPVIIIDVHWTVRTVIEFAIWGAGTWVAIDIIEAALA